jgi:ribonucleoside-diphosphate reductase beta chain
MALDNTLLPMSLYHKSKRLLWDPSEIDLTQDCADWARMSEREQALILRLSGQFLGGEEAVTHDLAPLLFAIRKQGGLMEEELFITAQLFEESKHVEWFDRWTQTIVGAPYAIEPGEAYTRLFDVELPGALHRLLTDASPAAQVEALVTYHFIIEGVLAETGYRGYVRALKDHGLMPGTVRGVELVQRDEARHIAYGLYAIGRLTRKDDALWDIAQARINTLLPVVLAIVGEMFAPFGDEIPFKLDPVEFMTYASEQFDHRMHALERDRAAE